MSLLVGWKPILKFAGLQNLGTLKKWIRKYNFPTLNLGNKTISSTEEIILWMRELRKNASIFEKPYKYDLNLKQKNYGKRQKKT